MSARRRTGGCLCGALRYEARGEPTLMGHCYCEDCRKASGSGFIPFMGYPRAAVTLHGEARQHVLRVANGRSAIRNFCAICGGLVFGGRPAVDATLNIYAGSLDDPCAFQPRIAIFVRGKPDWAVVPAGLQSFDGLPE